MTLRVVGSGLGRTGTLSLKLALERLLGGRCYHMVELFSHPEHVAMWHAAAKGEPVDWRALFEGYAAVVDWPACSFWREIADAFPGAVVLHSTRDAEAWWQSASQTIFPASRKAAGPWREMVDAMFAARFTDRVDDRDASVAAFERHNADVLASAPRHRLVSWQAHQGWEPLCDALGLAVPDEPFPRVNTREEFLAARDAGASEE
jgi:hypothetical protein